MSKKKAKTSKGAIPKRIAGVKVPKAVRKGRFGELLASRTGQAVIAQAILGAGAVAAGMRAKDNPKVQSAARKAKHTITDKADAAASDAGAGALAYALGEAARSFADAMRRGGPTQASAEDEASKWTPDYGAPEDRKATV